MTQVSPHEETEKAREAKLEAADEVMEALKDLRTAAGMPDEEDL